eukprot:4761440-Amphidinium_carterae.1
MASFTTRIDRGANMKNSSQHQQQTVRTTPTKPKQREAQIIPLRISKLIHIMFHFHFGQELLWGRLQLFPPKTTSKGCNA